MFFSHRSSIWLSRKQLILIAKSNLCFVEQGPSRDLEKASKALVSSIVGKGRTRVSLVSLSLSLFLWFPTKGTIEQLTQNELTGSYFQGSSALKHVAGA